MFSIAKRNIMLFFRDKTAVFFSLLSSLIVIVLYVVFLGGNLLGENPTPSMTFVVDSWLIAGLISISAFTGPLSAYDIMVADKNNNVFKSFSAAPIKKTSLTAGYVLSSVIIGVMISLITLIAGEIYIVINGGQILSFLTMLKVLGIVIIGTTANSALLFAIVSFIKSQSAFSAFSTIGGTIIGFFLGIYMPFGVLPAYVQTGLKFYPGTYMVGLLRDTFMAKPISLLVSELDPESSAAVIADLKGTLGVTYSWGSYDVASWLALLVLLVTIVIFYGLATVKLNIKKK